jgi:hypothetical protein
MIEVVEVLGGDEVVVTGPADTNVRVWWEDTAGRWVVTVESQEDES